jgi:hypothetical protein
MRQNQILPLTSYNNRRESETENRLVIWLVILIFCLLPLERVMFPFSVRIVDFALIVLILYGLMKVFSDLRIHLPLVMPIYLIFVASLIAMIASSAGFESILAVVQEAYIYVWFIILTSVLASFGLSDLERFMKIWCLIALMEATATFMGMLNLGPDIFYMSPEGGMILSSQGLNRAIGTYLNPNAAAAYLSISFFLLLATRWPAWLRSIFGIWLFVGIFATGSIAALASTIGSLAVLMVVYLALEHQRTDAFWGIVFGVGTGLTIVALLITILWPLISSVAEFAGESELLSLSVGRFSRSLASRFTLIEKAWSVYIQNPMGTGPNSFASDGATLHNDYIAFLFERGPLGAIGWLWVVGATLLVPLRIAFLQTDGRRRWQMLSLGAGFLACAVNALSREVSHFRQVWVLMAFLFATSYILSARSTDERIVE